MNYKWILFCPQLPATPSSPRVMVWRRMRSTGSVGLDNGLWILPYSEKASQFIQEMKNYVSTQGGVSRIFLANEFDADTESEIKDRFIQDRGEEYRELEEQCQDFLTEIEKEIKRENFSFAEYEENEQDFEKLENWFTRVRSRDYSESERASETSLWLDKCRESLQHFADAVFTHEGSKPPFLSDLQDENGKGKPASKSH